MNKAICQYIDEHRNDMITDLRILAEIPSVMGEAEEGAPFGKEPARALNTALELCEKYGLHTRNIDNYVGTADFFADTDNYLGILCHMDVVPEGSGWTFPPFAITEKDGRLYGRGAIDDKGPAVAALYALRAIKELGIPLDKNVRLILGTNEENGSDDLEYYTKKEQLPPLLVTPDGSYPVINIEKGMLRMSLQARLAPPAEGMIIKSIISDGAVNAVPFTASADILNITEEMFRSAAEGLNVDIAADGTRFTVNGKGAHASTPESGRNALTALFTIISRLDKAGAYPHISALTRLFPYGETDGLSCGIKCSDDISGGATTVLSVCDCDGENILCRQDIRFPVCESCAGIIQKLKSAAEKYGFIVTADMESEPHHVPADSDFIRTLLDVYEDATGEKGYTVAIGGGTYVHNTSGGVAFGAEFPGDKNNMHGADEFITTDSLLKNAKIYAEAIIRLCGKE